MSSAGANLLLSMSYGVATCHFFSCSPRVHAPSNKIAFLSSLHDTYFNPQNDYILHSKFSHATKNSSRSYMCATEEMMHDIVLVYYM